MTDSTHFLGPRGWAVLVLASGAALSAPFLRNPSTPNNNGAASGNPAEIDFTKNSWPDVREKTLTPETPIATNLSEKDWAELERLKSNVGTAPRKPTGSLPSTSTPLPSWADRGPRIDQLVNESIRTKPLEPLAPPSVSSSAGLEPLRPWVGNGMKRDPESTSTANETPLVGDFALKSSNPDARWHTVPSTFPSSTDPSHDSGALASNRPVRQFEDHVKQWPDEKLSPSQVAWDSPRTGQQDRTVAKPNSAWPSVSQPSPFPNTNQSNSSFANAPVSSPAISPVTSPVASSASRAEPSVQPDMVSAPMISSQSGRQVPKLKSPTIEPPKPSNTSPRPKHFIQQPAKRA